MTVTGRDHPGVTAALFDVLAEHGAQLGDVEQVVVHDRLLLGVVLSGPGDGAEVTAALTARAAALDVEVEFTPLEGDEPAGAGVRHHVTVLGQPLEPAASPASPGASRPAARTSSASCGCRATR